MGWNPAQLRRPEFLILGTMGGIRAPDGTPIALGYHTGHWEIGLLMQAAAEQFAALGMVPFAGYVSDPCDGRSQGTAGMMDSLPYRNDAAIVLRRLIRSLPTRKGVMGVATCDKGLPAMMMALASAHDMPSVLVPGGVTLPPTVGEDAGKVQSVGARFAHGEITLEEAAELGCHAAPRRAAAASSSARRRPARSWPRRWGLSLVHSALAPSGQPIWLDMARRSADALVGLFKAGVSHAATSSPRMRCTMRWSSTLPSAAARTCCCTFRPSPTPQVCRGPPSDDWEPHQPIRASPGGCAAQRPGRPPDGPRLPRRRRTGSDAASARPGPVAAGRAHRARPAAGRPARRMGTKRAAHGACASGSSRRTASTRTTSSCPRQRAAARGLTSTVTFPSGNLAPEGSVVKSTAIDPSVIDADGVYRKVGPARVFTSERAAIAAIKGQAAGEPVRPGDILVVVGRGPLGSGMEETYQLTSALRYLAWGKQVALITDARFSGVSTGACIGHVGPEGLAGGPIGRVREGDTIRIVIDTVNLEGSHRLWSATMDADCTPARRRRRPGRRAPQPGHGADPRLPDDTRLWAVLQSVSGGTWGGCVYDVDKIIQTLEAGQRALANT